MTPINYLFSGITDSFSTFWIIVTSGGWIVFVGVFFYILFIMYRDEIRVQFRNSQQWVFLEIRVPKENTTSMLAVEQMFAQWHSLHENFTWAETWIEGKTNLWYSLEIVSFGGKLAFIIRLPKKMKQNVTAAIYAQYPNAEVVEIEDYMKNMEYDPDTSPYEIWGTEFKYTADQAFPIKTYRDWEHPNNPIPEEKIIDPSAPLFNALTLIQPHEFMAIQLILRPVGDDEWKPHSEAVAAKIKGEEPEHSSGLLDVLMKPLDAFADFKPSSLIAGGGHGHGHDDVPVDKGNFMRLSDIQKERVTQIERKMGKPGYAFKLRALYLAPKERFDSTKRSALTGSFRTFSAVNLNKIKPDVHHTWTTQHYKISPTLEAPYINWALKWKKRRIFRGFKERSIIVGLDMSVMNIEEIASIFHLPISSDIAAINVEKIESKKVQPPVNLPIG